MPHRKAENTARTKAEEARTSRLLEEATAFRQASDIRAYVRGASEANNSSNENVPADQFERWATWALANAERIHPVKPRAFSRGIGEQAN